MELFYISILMGLCVSKLAELNIKLGQLKFLAYVNYALIKKCQEQCTSLTGSVFSFHSKQK